MLRDNAWECQDAACRAANDRFLDACAVCEAPRSGAKRAEAEATDQFRSATATSREAHLVRQRLQNKLRTQYQKKLDVIDDKAAATKKNGGGNGLYGFSGDVGFGAVSEGV